MPSSSTVTVGTVGVIPIATQQTNENYGLVGQIFQAPVDVSYLNFFRLYVDSMIPDPLNPPSSWNPTFTIRGWDPTPSVHPSQPIGRSASTLYQIPGNPFQAAGWFDFGPINVSVIPGDYYLGAVVWSSPVGLTYPLVPTSGQSPSQAIVSGPVLGLQADLVFEAQFSKEQVFLR